ncbi:hypothetical protein GCM10010840_36410 [Deinococcus aerolatus]|uniref:Uncharacterized protein n=1 Tax=Deinococcus aerolatus TaxID=522487 RepID=A0ABQ2GH84_9DEIO|nr:hypothetical protein GCM10010840_36410 [Deinococcus aerolatus]
MAADVAIGNFLYREVIDPLDDSNRSFIATSAVEGTGGLVWKCGIEGVSVFVYHPDEGYEKGEEYSITYRFDKRETEQMGGWHTGSSNTALFMDSSYINVFTVEALLSKQLVMRPNKPGIGLNVLTFKLDGLISALNELSCIDF